MSSWDWATNWDWGNPHLDSPGEVLIFEELFPGSDGSAWPAHWTLDGSAGATSTIQSNTGRMTTGALGSYNDYRRAVLADQGESDFDFTADLIVGAQQEKYAAFSWRTDRLWLGNPIWPGNGYVVEIEIDDNTSGYWAIHNVDGGTPTQLGGSDPYTVTAGDTLHLNVRCSGTSVEFRLWANADPKPGSPTFSLTDNVHNARTGHQIALNGGANTGVSVSWDNIRILAI